MKNVKHINDRYTSMQAFLDAWAAACKVEASTTVVPSDYEFLVGPIFFMDPCQPNIVLQVILLFSQK